MLEGPRPSLWEVPAGKENVRGGGPRVPMVFYGTPGAMIVLGRAVRSAVRVVMSAGAFESFITDVVV